MTESDAFEAIAAIIILAHVIGAAIVISIRQQGYRGRAARRGYASRLLRAWDINRPGAQS